MSGYIARRLWQMMPTMLGRHLLLVFLLFNWVGGDPAYVLAGKISNQEQIDNIRRQLGVDQPLLGAALDLRQAGPHRRLRRVAGAPTSRCRSILTTRLGPSLTVLVPLLILDTLISIGLALAVAYVRGSLTDRMVMIVCTVGLSISDPRLHHRLPVLLRLQARLVPSAGLGRQLLGEPVPSTASLPILIGLVVSIAPEPAALPHVRAGRDQPGLRAHRRAPRACRRTAIMWIHVLRNASIPIITHLMAALPGLAAAARS